MHIRLKSFGSLFVVWGIRSQGLDAQCRLLGTTHLTSRAHWLTAASFAFAWHQPMQKVITRTFWMRRTGYRGSWVIPPHQTWEPLYIISEKCSFLKKKRYVYAQQTCNICSWDILQKDWHPSHYVISDRGRNSSLWSVNFMQFFQRASTGSLKNPFSVFVITSPLPAGRVWWREQVFFHCPFLKRVCVILYHQLGNHGSAALFFFQEISDSTPIYWPLRSNFLRKIDLDCCITEREHIFIALEGGEQ